METVLTIEQAFQAMRYFLQQFNEREPSEQKQTIEFILSWTDRSSEDGGTADPAQWFDWEVCVNRVLQEPPPEPPPRSS